MKRPSCIEPFAVGHLVHIGFHKAYIVQASLGDAGSGSREGMRVAFYTHHLSRRSNQAGRQHGDISGARTDIWDTLA